MGMRNRGLITAVLLVILLSVILSAIAGLA